MERATFDDLVRLKLRQEKRREDSIELEVSSLGKTLQFTAPSRDQQLDFVGEVRKSGDISGSYDAYRRLVYDCCPALHNTELHSKLGVVDPYDVVDKLFGPVEVMGLGDRIADAYMSAIADDVKN